MKTMIALLVLIFALAAGLYFALESDPSIALYFLPVAVVAFGAMAWFRFASMAERRDDLRMRYLVGRAEREFDEAAREALDEGRDDPHSPSP